MKLIKTCLICCGLFFVLNCGGDSTTSENGGGTGLDTSVLADRFESAASELVPEITASAVAASLSRDPMFLTYNTETDWADYLDGENAYVLTDVFGSADEDPQVVTKIRVLLGQLKDNMSSLFTMDSNIDCSGGGASVLNEGDAISVAFYGDLDNGTSTDRYYDCVVEEDSSDEAGVDSYQTVTIYGQDSLGVLRMAMMSEYVMDNTQYVEDRGSKTHHYAVILAAYSEDVTDNGDGTETTTSLLDLQYNQASLYVGADETEGTSDDVGFKSRSRITGRVELDADGNPTSGDSDFSIVKYDRASTGDEMTTQTLGRGGYGAGEYSLFRVHSNLAALADATDVFCLVGTASLPTNTDSTNCTALETDYAWGTQTFAFDLEPAIAQTFEDNLFFEADDTDLIANEGTNFVIPPYTVVE